MVSRWNSAAADRLATTLRTVRMGPAVEFYKEFTSGNEINPGGSGAVQKPLEPVGIFFKQIPGLIPDFHEKPEPGQLGPVVWGAYHDKVSHPGYLS